MHTRGEAQFARLPWLAAWLYDLLMSGSSADHYAGLARDVAARIRRGRLLDVGTGPGRLLAELCAVAPELELLGLDISAAMVQRARRRLGQRARLSCGRSTAMPYDDASLDAVVSSGSFYQWDDPVAGLNEIRRVLKPGSSAYLYETHRDFDRAAFRAALARKLEQAGWLRRRASSQAALRQLDLAYRRSELEAIFERSRFAGAWQLEPLELGGLPGWLRATLTRHPPRS